MFPAAVCAISAIRSPFLQPIAVISCWPSLLLPLLHPLLLLLLPSADANAVPDKRLYSIGRLEYDMFAEHFLLPEDFDLAARTPTRKPSARELDALLNNELFEGDILGIDPQRLPSGESRMFFDDEYELVERRLLAEDQPADIGDDPVLDERRIFARPVRAFPASWHYFATRKQINPPRPSRAPKQHYSSLNTQTYANKLWKGAAVPYMLEEGMTPSQRAAIASAFDEYKGKTCVRFVPRQPGDEDYIYIKRNHAFGCSSYVGRAGGNQTVSLEVDKCFSKGIIAHELMHALGFFHEHSRTDRDEFVEILEQNVRPGMLRNFEKYPRKIIDPLGMPYDYESVMHYHKLAFSRNGRATIVPKKRNAEIGQRYKLSEIDAKKVNKLYRCDDEATVESMTTTTPTMTTTVPSTESSTAPPEEEMTTTTVDEQQTTSTEPAETPPSTTTIGAEGGRSSSTTSVAGGGGGEETPMPEEETTAEATTVAPTEESSTAVDGDEEEENGEGRRLPGPIGIRSQIRERPPGGGSSSGGGGWPAGMARKFITLSIWSTRGGEGGGGSGGNGRGKKDRKSKKSSSGLTRIKVEEKAGGGGGKTDKTSSTSSASRRVVKECLDLNAHCEMWERLGHCVHSPKYMRHYCRKSCGLCDSDERTEQESRLTCTDRNHFCSYWARNGECDNGSKFMKLFCKRSCGLCLN